MTGHEIAEVWSNDYGKWMHLDATRDYYWYDPKTLVPLDTEEIHQVLAERLERPERWDRPYLFHQDLEAVVKDLPIAFYDGDYEHSTEEGSLFLVPLVLPLPHRTALRRVQPAPSPAGEPRYRSVVVERLPQLGRRPSPATTPTLPSTQIGERISTRRSIKRGTVAEAIDERQLRIYLETETPGFTDLPSADRRTIMAGVSGPDRLDAARRTERAGDAHLE